jgi:hypothetical protein
VHDENSHLGISKCFQNLLSSGIYWCNMFNDLNDYVKSCQQCNSSNPFRGRMKRERPELRPHDTVGIFSRVHIDILKLGVTSHSGYNYILSAVDSASKYVFLYPLVNQNAVEIANKLFEMFSFTGIVGSLMSDRNPQFLNEIMENLSKILGFKTYVTSSYRPASNGLVEKTQSTVLKCFRTLLKDEKCWDTYIPHVLLTLRSAKSRATNISPAQLLFGFEIRSRLTALLDPTKDIITEDSVGRPEKFDQFVKSLEMLRKIARDNTDVTIGDYKKAYDEGGKFSDFRIGQPVFVYNNVQKKDQKSKKLKTISSRDRFISKRYLLTIRTC